MKFALKTIALPLAGGLGGYTVLKRRLFRVAKGEGAKTSPVRGGFTPSKRAAGRRPFEAQGRVSRSAERDLRNFLRKVP